jgi:signal peptidase I
MNDVLTCTSELLTSLLEELLERGTVTLKVTGKSMHPTIKHGDVITLAAYGASTPRVGDIVAFSRGTKLWIHRIVRKAPGGSDTGIVTAGDGNEESDAPVSLAAVLGRVVEVRQPTAVWRPDSLGRRATGLLRAHLSRHEKLRRVLSRGARAQRTARACCSSALRKG